MMMHNFQLQQSMELMLLSSLSSLNVIALELIQQELMELDHSMEISANTHLLVITNLVLMMVFVLMKGKINLLVIVLILYHQTQLNHSMELSVKSPKLQLVILILVKMEEYVPLMNLNHQDTLVVVLEDGPDQLVPFHQLLDVNQPPVNHLEFVLHPQILYQHLLSLNVSVCTDILEIVVELHQPDVMLRPVRMEEPVLDFMELIHQTLTVYVHILGLDNIVNGTQLLTILRHLRLQAYSLLLLLSWPLLFK